MKKDLYNPFNKFAFDNKTCFLSGEALTNPITYPVFPEWIINGFGLKGQSFKMLDESYKTYEQITVPCSPEVKKLLDQLDSEVANAFHKGFEEVNSLNKTRLFQWISTWVYGIIFNEIQSGIKQQALANEPINFSQALVQKFSNLHKMMQSILYPTEFETVSPFSIFIFPVNNIEDFFNYRDEINTLVFSLRMNDFGMIVSLQDNETSKKYHSEILEKIEGKVLHPIQFEEICARFFYSAYLFNRLPDYTIMQTPEKIFIEPMPLIGVNSRPIFDHWQAKTYGQVLENFWKPWGYTLFEIIKDPENPMSFIQNEKDEFIEASAIELPLA
jgi:hypothetical protein